MSGQVVSEVWSSGKKYRSFVKSMGGQTAVQTAYATETAQLNESVIFEYRDATGMSYRTTDKDANEVATGDGGEGSPIETDPLGGSVGLHTPYFEPVAYHPEPVYPELQSFADRDGISPFGLDFDSLYATFGSRVADLPGFGTNWGSFSELGLQLEGERANNSLHGAGFHTNEEIGLPPGVILRGYGVRYPDADHTVRGGTWSYDRAVRMSEGVGTIFATWDDNDDWSNFSWQTQEIGTRSRLTERDQLQYDKKRQEVRDRLNNITDKCRDFLTKAGLTVESVLEAVNLQNAYDGERSTISMSDAGYYSKDNLSSFDEKRRNGLLNQKMSGWIKKNAKAATMFYPSGANTNVVNGSLAQRSNVYFQIDYSNGLFGLGKGYGLNSGLTQTTILHEALHSLTGLGDDNLFKLLTGTSASSGTSAGISQALKDNDCTD